MTGTVGRLGLFDNEELAARAVYEQANAARVTEGG